jgi:hypothetical protein
MTVLRAFCKAAHAAPNPGWTGGVNEIRPHFHLRRGFMRHMKPRDAKPMALVDRFWRLPAKDR